MIKPSRLRIYYHYRNIMFTHGFSVREPDRVSIGYSFIPAKKCFYCSVEWFTEAEYHIYDFLSYDYMTNGQYEILDRNTHSQIKFYEF